MTGMNIKHRHPRDQGQVAVEYLGFLPILLLVALAAIQLGLIAYAGQQAGTAARTAARSAALHRDYQGDCQAAVSSWLKASCSAADQGDTVQVTSSIDIPSVFPGWDFGQAHKTATMPTDH